MSLWSDIFAFSILANVKVAFYVSHRLETTTYFNDTAREHCVIVLTFANGVKYHIPASAIFQNKKLKEIQNADKITKLSDSFS